MADDIADSWEDWEDSGELDKKLASTTAAQLKKSEPSEGKAAGQTLQEEGHRTAYQPQVRILRRQPDSPGSAVNNGNRLAPSTRPTKSLEEREAAYAEARLRILGASSDENTADERPARLAEQLAEIKVSENVIRQPRGPDGGPGFNRNNKP